MKKLYCKLGDIKFDFLNSPISNETEEVHTFAEIKPAYGLPFLQDRGEELTSKKLSFHFHRKFTNPEEMYEKLKTARISAEALPLVYASGRYDGDFVIESMSKVSAVEDSLGNIISIDVNVSLKASTDKNEQESKKNSGGKTFKKDPAESGGDYQTSTANEIVRV